MMFNFVTFVVAAALLPSAFAAPQALTSTLGGAVTRTIAGPSTASSRIITTTAPITSTSSTRVNNGTVTSRTISTTASTTTLPPIPTGYVIHPNFDLANPDNQKCVGVVGGVLANGIPVDIYDCNGSNTQKWHWFGRQLALVNGTTGEHWCLDAGNVDQIANGVKMKIWQCFANLPQQTWLRPDVDDGYTGPIALSVDNKCLDLTDGSKANRNVLQIWDCVGSGANPNQIWTIRA